MKRRSDIPPQRYEPTGMLAVDPRAFLEMFIVPASRDNEMLGSVCVVEVCGPLDARDTGWADSYESIKMRVAHACESPASVILLRMDSPGGAVKGCFDTVKTIRAMCAKAQKPLYAFCEYACSAGYALATAAERVYASETALIGSIGVVERRADVSVANARDGLRVEFIASGARKAYGNADLPITDDELKAKQDVVNATAGVFFALVEETRGLKASAVASLQAGVFHAEAARAARLVDEVTTFETLLARLASGGNMADDDKDKDASPYDAARKSLEQAAKGDDANARSAKRALAALDADDGPGDDDDDDDDASAADGDDDEADAAAAASDDMPDEAGKKKPAAAAAAAAAAPAAAAAEASNSVALQALAEAHALKAQYATDKERGLRKRLISKRPDFGKELRAELLKAETPIATVRNLVKTLPLGKVVTAETKAAAATATGTRGAGQADTTVDAGADPRTADAADMDMRMGLTAQTIGVKRTRNTLEFGVVNQPIAPAANSGAAGGSK